MADNPVLPSYILNAPDPAAAVRSNVELAIGIQQAQRQQAAAQQEQQLRQLQIQSAQNAQNRQQQLNSDMSALGPNPTTTDIARLSGKYPELKDHFKATFDMLTQTEKDASVNLGQKVYNALNTGAPDVAAQSASEAATAFRNSNQPARADAMDSIAKLITSGNPGGAKFAIGTFLSHAMGSEEFQKMMLTPDEARIKAAAAKSGEIDASLEKSKVEGEIAQSTDAAAASRAQAGNLRSETQAREDLRPYNILNAGYDASVKAEGPAQAQAKTLSDQAKAREDQIRANLAEKMGKAGLSSAESDAVVKYYAALNAPKAQDAATRSAVAGAQSAEAGASVAKPLADLSVQAAKQKLNAPPDGGKRIAELSGNITEAQRDANTADSLVTRMNNLSAGGIPARTAEFWNRLAGTETPASLLRKQIAGFSNKELLSMFPPGGRLNESIIDQMRQGIFDPTSNPEAIQGLFKAISTRRKADATLGQTEKDWQIANGSSGLKPLTRPSMINGMLVPAGTDYNDHISKAVLPTIPQGAGGSAAPLDSKDIPRVRSILNQPGLPAWKKAALRARMLASGEDA